jgi:chaperonin GroEL
MEKQILKTIISGDDAKKKLLNGLKQAEKVVGDTMGYRGLLTLSEDDGDMPDFSKDGYNLLKQIFLPDSVENLAVSVAKEASEQTVTMAGDATTGTIVLAYNLFKLALDKVKKGYSAIDVKNQLEKSRDLVLAELDNLAIELNDKLLYDVAKTSCSNDEVLAKIISEAFYKSGENGSVAYVRNSTEENDLEFIEGTLFESGYSDELFVNKQDDRTVVFKDNPLVLVSSINIQTIREIQPFILFAFQQQKELLIISDMEFQVENVLITNKVDKNFRVCVVKPSSYGKKKRDFLEDVAKVCGTTLLSTLSGSDFVGRETMFLGSAKQVLVSAKNTVILGNFENETIKNDVQGKIAELKEVIKNTKNQLEKKHLKDRIAKLSGGVSIIKIGAVTEAELKEKLDRVDDAVQAIRSAKEQGVLAGGGIALLHCSTLDGICDVSEQALKSTNARILSNAGLDVLQEPRYPIGVDVRNYKDVNMIDAGIVDSNKAIKNSFINAVSVCGTLLMTENVIIKKRLYDEQ